MATTYVQIATSTAPLLGSASFSFTSIPSTYTDLILVYSGRTSEITGTFYEVSLTLNGSTSGFSAKQLYADGSSSGSSSPTTRQAGLLGNVATTSNTFCNNQIYFSNYAGSANKSYSVNSVTENNAATSYISILAGLWSNTAAISSMSIAPTSGNFVQYSTATLYGIKKD
jgi:hypothetical protein